MTDNQKKWVYIIAGVIAFVLLLLIAKKARETESKVMDNPKTNPLNSPNVILWGKNGYPIVTPAIASLPAEQLNYLTNMPVSLTANIGGLQGIGGLGGFGGDTSVYVPLFGFVGYTDYALY